MTDITTYKLDWGADQQLNQDAKWLDTNAIRQAMRPKPPSLKEQALAVIENSAICDHLSPEHATILRRALETLDD